MKILYIAHSSERIHRRTAYSILSCLQIHGGKAPCPVELATDNPDFYRPFGDLVGIRPLAPARIAEWVEAAKGYRNVVKAELFRGQEDSFLFLDSDTVLLKPLPPLLDRIRPKATIMQRREYRLGGRPEFRDVVADSVFPELTADTWMYNSGLLGVHRDNLPTLRKVKDRVLELLARHRVRTPEQLLDGTLLSQVSEILTAPRWIYHYWQDKAFPDAFMDRFFDGMGLAEMVRRVAGGDGAPLFALGFRRNPFLYDLYMRVTARLEMLSERFRSPCRS